jgi:hypothetical protein
MTKRIDPDIKALAAAVCAEGGEVSERAKLVTLCSGNGWIELNTWVCPGCAACLAPPPAHPPEGSQPPDCPNCDGVEGMHTLRSCLSPPAAHPPEGSREPQKWPCRVAKGTQCSSEMCEPPTPPPGPGQDVEAQARALVIQFEALPHCEHPDWAMLQCFDCWVKFWAAALRAAQAEAERRAQEAEHGIARWEVYAQGLEAQVRSVREALVGVRRDGGPLNACWCPRLVRQAEQPQPHTPDCIKATRALSSSPVSSQSEPKA